MRTRGAADMMSIVLVALVLGGAGTGGYAYMLYDESATLERKLKQAENDLKKAINVRDDLRDIKASGQSVSQADTDTIQTFFHEKAKEHKFQINRITAPKGRYKEWEEQSYRLEIKNVSRQQLGNFVADVQLNKPFLKSKEIREVKLDDNHFITTAVVVFSHYQRAKK